MTFSSIAGSSTSSITSSTSITSGTSSLPIVSGSTSSIMNFSSMASNSTSSSTSSASITRGANSPRVVSDSGSCITSYSCIASSSRCNRRLLPADQRYRLDSDYQSFVLFICRNMISVEIVGDSYLTHLQYNKPKKRSAVCAAWNSCILDSYTYAKLPVCSQW